MTTLETRLVSCQISFAEIWQLGYKRAQYGLNGRIINVPVDFDKVQQALPRQMDEARTIVVWLKKISEYESAYVQGNDQSACIIHALVELSKTSLYLKENITINSDWESLFNNNKECKQQDIEEDTYVD